MGIDSRKAPPLPAPTETETNNTTPTELTADVFKPSDEKSSYSIPEDGTPVTIATRGHKANKSQTSLLIEYFEGGKQSSSSTGERRPSVRVRLTPSKKSRGDHIQLTETKGSRQASLTRRIPLTLATELEYLDGEDGNSISSYASATEESNVSRNPIDIEIDHSHRRRRPASPLIPSESYQVNASEISAIPTDSFLDGTGGGSTELKNSFNQSKGEDLAVAAGTGALAAVAMDETRSHKSRNRERVKIAEKSKEKSDRKRRPKSRTSSVSERTADDLKSPRARRSSRSHQESTVSAADSSVISNMTPSHRSVDTHSTRSGVSKSSINNPKLLETVEDAIRRLILPELSALKREQSKRETRRGSFTSTATSLSREEATPDRRRSSGQRSDQKDRRNREARHDYGDSSLHSISRESLDDGYQYDNDIVTPKRSGDLLKAATATAATSKGLSLLDDKSQSEDRKHRERRRRRAESSRSRSVGRDRYAEEYDDDHLVVPAPPMPLQSEINASELTRTSILSANTDRPHSATEELTPVHNVARGPVSATSTPTPSNELDNTLLTQHANVSHGDLTALPRGQREYEEYETDEFGHKVEDIHYDDEDPHDVSDNGDYPENGYDNSYFATQDVPPPLKYVPYQAGARGLSPIPSVSGYTDGASEHQPRNSRSMHSTSDAYSALERRSPEHPRNSRSINSLNSLRARELDQMSPRSSGVDYRNTTYTDDSELDRVTSGQAVRGIGANPNIIHPPLGVESAVASLIDGSMLEQSVLTTGSGYDYGGARDSNLSYDDQSRTYSSRGMSPEKQFTDASRGVETERHATPNSRSHKPSQEFTEYEIDEHGRKVPRTKSPTASEVAITAGAVGAAAAALKAAQGKKQAPVEEEMIDEDYQPVGVFRNKSFKERTLEGHEPRNTPTHSIDRLDYDEPPKMSASFMPGFHDPMPEIGYVDDDAQTNPSIIDHRLDGEPGDEEMSGRATPTQQSVRGYQHDEVHSQASGAGGRGLNPAEVGALGAAAGLAAAHTHSREPSHDADEWQRSSDDQKRDTLVTNPFEDASPIANPALNEGLLGARGLNSSYGAPYHSGSPGFTQKYDEGYMSNGPNRTPDADPKNDTLDLGATLVAPAGDDPFYVPKDHVRHLSGMSQGMASPFYDAATGQGIERIENRDIVALMQHLMVRDAQRSARDTEIVALLMNAALEMRNSFREMKDLIQDTGDDVIFSNAENTEKLQKAINGPRPYPGTGARSIQSASQVDTLNDAAAKKKNLWKRALQGLSAKGTSDLSRIEDMLMQLLGEVDVLKTQTAPPPVSTSGGRASSFENLQPEGQYENDRGYEPEGTSTISHGSQSGHLSLSQSRSKLRDERKFSDHRISTVQEHAEEYQYDHPSPVTERADPNLLTPTRSVGNLQRGNSVPLDTPPQPSASNQHPMSAENTPRTGKKHKASGSSGWLPKISRWSGTTASSVGKAFRGSGKKESKYEDYAPSRSGSSLASYNEEDDYHHEQHNQRNQHHQQNPYDEDKLHTGFSEQELAGTAAESNLDATVAQRDSNFTPDEAPKYKVHRNSLNLQHPQPRPGQTERFRNALEYSAQEYDIPMTPRSADWAGSATSVNRLPPNTNRYSTASSAGAREPEYWGSSPTGPPRPPKEPVDNSGTRTPPRSRISKLAKGSPLQHQSDESGYPTHQSASPKPENRNLNAALGMPTRRPSGPRAMTPKSPDEETAREERRRKRDTFGTIASAQTDDTDTF
ncbi:hypothetical protein BGZ61DRAFT_477531 [Ilyonectria robusta]|uniref:uncharacterized protein n=1 Tax=Ilyonectria robusta TaxID=1079257 RepID=UPI001E8D8945|nr:uncharacterized protein BGZ61DRAFT_477531 [Ilyonectria robusta]KAH8699535.1 hypothetical protein BGZ61DRAFT_477531 [Ilyonectria robusta]